MVGNGATKGCIIISSTQCKSLVLLKRHLHHLLKESDTDSQPWTMSLSVTPTYI